MANVEPAIAAIGDVLLTIVEKISNSFHTEGELLSLRAQIGGIVNLIEADVNTDVAGLVSPGAPVAVDGPAPVAQNPFVNA